MTDGERGDADGPGAIEMSNLLFGAAILLERNPDDAEAIQHAIDTMRIVCRMLRLLEALSTGRGREGT